MEGKQQHLQQYRDTNHNLMNQINGQNSATDDSIDDNRTTRSGVFARMYPKDDEMLDKAEESKVKSAANTAVNHEDIDFYWDNPEQTHGRRSEIIEMMKRNMSN